MSFSRKCVIGSLIVAVIIIGGSIGIFFAVSSRKSDETPVVTSDLLIKSFDGTVKLYAHKYKAFTEIKIEEKSLGITSYGPYLDQTIYYATTEPKSVIYSTNNTAFPALPAFTADWIKTAIAVDDVTNNVYVVDRIAGKIKVVQERYQYNLPLRALDEPKDVILLPESGKMFVLEESKIIMADIDGTNATEILKANNLRAMTVDTFNRILYFAHQNGIESYQYNGTKKRDFVSDSEIYVKSLAYKDNVLYIINKRGKSSKSPGTSLDICRLDNSKCAGKCCSIFVVLQNEQLEQVKIYNTDKPQTKNPCKTKNGDCEQLCLLNSSKEGRSCACDNNWPLNPDNKTCLKAT